MNQNAKEYKIGMICALSCMILWGLLPIYWKLLQNIDSLLIMFYRLVCSCLLVSVVSLFVIKKDIFAPLKKKGAKLTFFLAGLIISGNWGLYIWAVNSGFIIQTSIGYYMEPLVICVFGMLLFHEKLDKYKTTAFVMALIGVAVMLISYGEIPVIALALACTFATYAAIKKKVQVNAIQALLFETMFLVPIILPIILYLEFTGQGALATATNGELVLLFFSGLVTAIPLILFAMAANRIDFITLGVTEYIAPSIALILGIFVYKEPFDQAQFIAFVFLWIGLAVFTYGGFKNSRRQNAAFSETDGDLHTEPAEVAVTKNIDAEMKIEASAESVQQTLKEAERTDRTESHEPRTEEQAVDDDDNDKACGK